MDISANNIPYWMVEQTVPYSPEDMQLKKEERNGRAIKIEPPDKQTDSQQDKLKQRDQAVKQHESAPMAAAGAHAKGGASYTYQTGEDGKPYAVGGHVSIDTSKEDTPEATIQKMQQIISSAKAPAEPSTQDLKVAAQAAMTLQEAREELSDKKKAEKESKSSSSLKLEEAYKGSSMKNTFSVSA